MPVRPIPNRPADGTGDTGRMTPQPTGRRPGIDTVRPVAEAGHDDDRSTRQARKKLAARPGG